MYQRKAVRAHLKHCQALKEDLHLPFHEVMFFSSRKDSDPLIDYK